MVDEKKKIPVVCEHCKHKWKTVSDYAMLTCPFCLNKTPNPNAEKIKKEE
jgi:hypothetical protein